MEIKDIFLKDKRVDKYLEKYKEELSTEEGREAFFKRVEKFMKDRGLKTERKIIDGKICFVFSKETDKMIL